MEGIVKDVKANGTFKEYYVFEITVDMNGKEENYKVYRTTDNPFLTIGDSISFTVNDKGSMKNIEKYESQGVNKAQEKSFEPQINKQKQLSIERQSSLKLAFDFLANQSDKFKPSDVIKLADYWVVYIETGEVPSGDAYNMDDPPF